MLVDTRSEIPTGFLEDSFEEPRLSQVLPPVKRGYAKVERVILAIDRQELPFEDSRSLFIFEMWSQKPETTRQRVMNAFDGGVEQALDLTLDDRIIKREVDRVCSDLGYEYNKFQKELDRLNHRNVHK